MSERKPLERPDDPAPALEGWKYCARCDNRLWVCEFHPDRPWEGPRACGCGGAGAPCPVCNRVDEDTEPEMPDDFVVDKRVRDLD